jgi:hypothetical protein
MNKVIDFKTKAMERLYKNCFIHNNLTGKQINKLMKIAQN